MSTRFTDLADWLQWQEGLHPSAIDLGLARIRRVAATLFGEDFAVRQPFTITVAGTNGKGSCVTTLGVLLAACGKRVGTFTSPHIHRYNERIRIDGQPVTDAELCHAFVAIDAARGDTSLTYFEFSALAALWLFQQHQVDVQVLEVGLGGRLDAVNMIDAAIAVITNIAIDHTDWLGNTRDQIGQEKAGILRAHSKLVYGETAMPASICTRIQALSVECRQAGTAFTFSASGQAWQWQGLSTNSEPLVLHCAAPSLPWPSVACALQVMAWMNLWLPESFARALPALMLEGRFERVTVNGKQLIFDVAHNEAGAQFLSHKIMAMQEQAPMDILFAAMADKDLAGMVSALKPAIAHWYLVSLDNNARAATPEQLAAVLETQGIGMTQYTCISEPAAVQQAVQSDPSRVLLVAGSFFTVAAIKAVILPEQGCPL